ncbi:uncharacterized protein LOC6493165 [Drosophila ananassae]|uniref:uncharacterized protein LOC6493165 n=1 Tax=Drosophila ananassae TaxID=7217 RepID=UPI000177C870|nr:uncharacterized protein LOC6493165 [Drosophila ananassae]
MSRAVLNSQGPGRIPGGQMMRRMLLSSEVAADEASLEFYENWNQAWRTQYKHPTLASLGIGIEFAPRKGRQLSSALSTQDDDTENQVIGNSSLTRTVDPTLPPALYEYLAESGDSEDENLIQFLA